MIHPTISLAHVDLQAFLQLHGEALQNAALLLGGNPALRRTQRLLEEIGTQHALTPRLRREFEALHALLSLEHVHDPERAEAGYFAMIDPEWGDVADICLLDEALVECLDRLDAEAAGRSPLRRAA